VVGIPRLSTGNGSRSRYPRTFGVEFDTIAPNFCVARDELKRSSLSNAWVDILINKLARGARQNDKDATNAGAERPFHSKAMVEHRVTGEGLHKVCENYIRWPPST